MSTRTFIPLAVLAMLSSCSEPTPTGGISNPIVAQFNVSRTVYGNAAGTTITDQAQAELTSEIFNSAANGGDVSLSGTRLTWTGSSYENLNPQGSRFGLPLSFDGRFLVFTVSGSPQFAAMIDSIKAPLRPLNVTFPTPADTVSRSTGFTITWAETGADNVYVIVNDSSTTDQGTFLKTDTDDDGSYTVSPVDLAGMTTGPIKVIVVCQKRKTVVRPGERSRTLSVASAYVIYLRLKP